MRKKDSDKLDEIENKLKTSLRATLLKDEDSDSDNNNYHREESDDDFL